MNGKKNTKIRLNNTSGKFKINKKRVGICVIAFIAIVVIMSLFLKPMFYSKNIKRVRSWNISENYDLGTAANDAMKHVKWKNKKGIVTLTGKDRKTNDEIVITFKVGEYMSFDSMTREGQSLEYYDWEVYMKSYKEK